MSEQHDNNEVKFTSILLEDKPESHQTNTKASKIEEVRILM